MGAWRRTGCREQMRKRVTAHAELVRVGCWVAVASCGQCSAQAKATDVDEHLAMSKATKALRRAAHDDPCHSSNV